MDLSNLQIREYPVGRLSTKQHRDEILNKANNGYVIYVTDKNGNAWFLMSEGVMNDFLAGTGWSINRRTDSEKK